MISPLRGTILAVIVLSASCARYAPHPFNTAEHRTAWLARQADSPDVVEFARRLAASHPQAAPFDPSDGVSLSEAEVIGLFFNGGLRAARAKLSIAEAGAARAGLWSDPTLDLSVQRVLEFSTEPWIVAADAALSIPLWGTGRIEKDLANAQLTARAWRTVNEEWEFAHALRREWIEWSALELKATLALDQLKQVERIRAVAQTLADANEIPRTEARLFAIEEAAMGQESRHFAHEAEERAMRIKLRLGIRPEAELKLIPAIQPFELPVANEAEATEAKLVAAHPSLQALRAEHAEAESVLQREIRGALPSLNSGPGYESDEGRNKLGANASVGLPLWNRNQRAIAEAEASVEAARIATESEIERLTGELALARHALASAQADRLHLEEAVAPLVEEQLREARALAELGELQALLLLEAIKSSHETKLRMIDAQAEVARASADVLSLLPNQPIPTAIKEPIHHADH